MTVAVLCGGRSVGPPAMSRSAPAGPAVAPFWEMLSLLAREPGMEWLELGLAGQAATFPRGSRGAACRTQAVAHPGASRRCGERGAEVSGKCGPCCAVGLAAHAAVVTRWGWHLTPGGGRAGRWQPWLPPGSVSFVVLAFLGKAGALGGLEGVHLPAVENMLSSGGSVLCALCSHNLCKPC